MNSGCLKSNKSGAFNVDEWIVRHKGSVVPVEDNAGDGDLT